MKVCKKCFLQESERVKIDCLEALKEEKSQLSQELDNVHHKLEEGKILVWFNPANSVLCRVGLIN